MLCCVPVYSSAVGVDRVLSVVDVWEDEERVLLAVADFDKQRSKRNLAEAVTSAGCVCYCATTASPPTLISSRPRTCTARLFALFIHIECPKTGAAHDEGHLQGIRAVRSSSCPSRRQRTKH